MNIDTTVTDVYKEYIKRLRLLEFETVYPIVTYDTTPKLKEYVKQLIEAPFIHGEQDIFYGDIKKVVTSYICFHTDFVDETIKKWHDYSETCTMQQFMFLVDDTIETQKTKQLDFVSEYLPTRSKYEKDCYENIEAMYVFYIEQLHRIRKQGEIPQESSINVAFMKNYLSKMLNGESARFQFTQKYLSSIILGRIREIDISIFCNYRRLSNNLRSMEEYATWEVTCLINELYKKNDEWLMMQRTNLRHEDHSQRLAEIARAIVNTRRRIEETNNKILLNIEEEINYWARKSVTVYDLVNNLDLLEEEYKSLKEQEEVLLQEGINNKSEDNNTLGIILKAKEVIETKMERIGMALFTVFDVKGDDEVWFKDVNGRKYCIDGYEHKVFSVSHKKKLLHVNCEGTCTEPSESHKQYYDHFGRYILDKNGNKAYQAAPCTSFHKLDKLRGNIYKTTQDCGHSEEIKKDCKMNINNIYKPREPEVPNIDYKDTLDKDTVQYLWKAFGWILPKVLVDCARVKPKNVAHFIAHSLIKYKYRKPLNQHIHKHHKKNKHGHELFHHKKRTYGIEDLFIYDMYMMSAEFDYDDF